MMGHASSCIVPCATVIVLETARLVLRRLRPDDLDALFALYRDPETRRYFPDGTRTLDETHEELSWFLNGYPRDPRLGLWATLDKATGAFIGRCGLLPWTIDGRDEVEVAYLLDRAYWGRGLASEAARGIVHHAFVSLDVARLISLVDPANVASQRVAMNAGMRWAGETDDADDGREPARIYAVTREEHALGDDGSIAAPSSSTVR
jgi:[ribosomal protein S5]-alanine N-acetyltransferase